MLQALASSKVVGNQDPKFFQPSGELGECLGVELLLCPNCCHLSIMLGDRLLMLGDRLLTAGKPLAQDGSDFCHLLVMARNGGLMGSSNFGQFARFHDQFCADFGQYSLLAQISSCSFDEVESQEIAVTRNKRSPE